MPKSPSTLSARRDAWRRLQAVAEIIRQVGTDRSLRVSVATDADRDAYVPEEAKDILRELKAARREILVQAYSFTADPLTFGLVDAKKQGITVEIVLDKSNELERYSDLHIFMENGVDVLIDHDHAIAHNKIIIIDKKEG